MNTNLKQNQGNPGEIMEYIKKSTLYGFPSLRKKNSSIRIIFNISFTLFIIGCSTTGRITNLTHKPAKSNAIIIARFSIIDSGQDVAANSLIYFDNRLGGTYVRPDKQNYIYMELPVGKHFIASLWYEPFKKALPDSYATIDLPQSKIYYIGDISINANFSYKDGFVPGLLGLIYEKNKKGVAVPIEIIDRFDSTTTYFNRKFQNNSPIEKALLRVVQ